MPGFANTVMFADNVDFSGGHPVVAKVVADGQLLIGSTAAPNIKVNTLTAGTGISIANGSGSITISALTGAMAWTDKAASFSAIKENGYFVTAAATATLPASNSQGDTIKFIVTTATASALTIQAAGGATIRVNTQVSSANGTAFNATAGDGIELVFQAASNEWWALSREGNWQTT